MKPAPFDYYAPGTVEEALGLLGIIVGAKVLAGGQSLIPMMNMRLATPPALVDLRRIEALSQQSLTSRGIVLGAMTCHRSIESEPTIASLCPILPASAKLISHFQIRERGTIGGSLVHADPSAEWPMIAVLTDATLTLAGPTKTRQIPARDFFVSVFTTTIETGEILTKVRFPVLPPATGWAVREVARRRGDFAIVAASALTTESDGRYAAGSIALAGVSGTPLLAAAAERLVGQKPSAELWREVANAVGDEIEPETDVHATAEDRRDIARTLVTRVLSEAHHRSHLSNEDHL